MKANTLFIYIDDQKERRYASKISKTFHIQPEKEEFEINPDFSCI